MYYKKIVNLLILVVIFLDCSQETFGQGDDSLALVKEINRQIWIPFAESWNNMDFVAFNALHMADIKRINAYGGIRIGERYKKSNEEGFLRTISKGDKRSIRFRFDSRIVSAQMAYETGIYEVTIVPNKNNNSAERKYYGYFHVLLQKEEGHWRIAQDWDTNKLLNKNVELSHFNRLHDPKF